MLTGSGRGEGEHVRVRGVEEEARGARAQRAQVEVAPAAPIVILRVLPIAIRIGRPDIATAIAERVRGGRHGRRRTRGLKRMREVREVRLVAPGARARHVDVQLAVRAVVLRPAASLPAHVAHEEPRHVRRGREQHKRVVDGRLGSTRSGSPSVLARPFRFGLHT